MNRAVEDFLAQGGAARICLEQFSAYVPELNPDEETWSYLKCSEPRNVCGDDLTELRLELGLATARLRHQRAVPRGGITQRGYAV